MTANLLTPVREEEIENPMKRHPIMKLAFATLCCALITLIAAPAWADQCSAPSVGQGTGIVGNANGANTCGAVITVLTVDSSGNATTFSVDTSTPNGNPYDGTEDTLIGVQNNSGSNLNNITLSSSVLASDGHGIFGFDGDGPCTVHTPQYSWCTTSGFTGYEGPDNSFNIGADEKSGTVHFTTAIPNGGSIWFAMEGTPNAVLFFQGPITNVSGGGSFNLTPNGAPVSQTISFPTGTTFGGGVVYMQLIETPVDPTTFNSANFPATGTNSFSGGSPVPSTTQCLQIGSNCFSLVIKCFSDAGGTMQVPCTGIAAGGKLINLTSGFQTPTTIHNPAMLIATDDPVPLNDWANITTSFDPGDTCLNPPCSGGGGTKGLNTRIVLADLNVGCDVLTYTLSPTSGPVGTSVNVNGSLKGCQFVSGEKMLFGALTASLTFRLTGPQNPPGCTMQTVVAQPLPLFLPFNSNIPFNFKLKIPKNACQGKSEVTSLILSGNVPFVWAATFTVTP